VKCNCVRNELYENAIEKAVVHALFIPLIESSGEIRDRGGNIDNSGHLHWGNNNQGMVVRVRPIFFSGLISGCSNMRAWINTQIFVVTTACVNGPHGGLIGAVSKHSIIGVVSGGTLVWFIMPLKIKSLVFTLLQHTTPLWQLWMT
jgi:hypothetical protein